MNLSKKVLTSILCASFATTIIQCEGVKKPAKAKAKQAKCVKDSVKIDTIYNDDKDCQACGMG